MAGPVAGQGSKGVARCRRVSWRGSGTRTDCCSIGPMQMPCLSSRMPRTGVIATATMPRQCARLTGTSASASISALATYAYTPPRTPPTSTCLPVTNTVRRPDQGQQATHLRAWRSNAIWPRRLPRAMPPEPSSPIISICAEHYLTDGVPSTVSVRRQESVSLLDPSRERQCSTGRVHELSPYLPGFMRRHVRFGALQRPRFRAPIKHHHDKQR